MEPIVKLNESALRAQAASAVRAGDIDALGAVIRTVDEARQQYEATIKRDVAALREIEIAMPNLARGLASLPESEGRQRFSDLTYQRELLTSRIQLCQEQMSVATRLLEQFRRESEAVQGRVLTAQLARRAIALGDLLESCKAALAPLKDACEKVFALLRTIEEFNQEHQHAKIAMPGLSGDPGVIQKVFDLKLTLPIEWRDLGRDERRIVLSLPYHDRQKGEVLILSAPEAAHLIQTGYAEPLE